MLNQDTSKIKELLNLKIHEYDQLVELSKQEKLSLQENI